MNHKLRFGLSTARGDLAQSLVAGWLLAGLLCGSWAEVASAERPNIVFMLADDQAWNGLSVAMHPDLDGSRSRLYHTPSLEKFAAQGMRFSCAYAPAPVCSPTRISLQTGKSPAALHWTKAAPPETGHKLLEPRNVKSLAASETTLAELLRAAGYRTAHYGKWHLSGGGPGAHGYDEHDGDTGNEHADKFVDPNPVDLFGMATRAEAFMAASQRAGKPFYLQLSWNALHGAGNALQATQAKYAGLGEGKSVERAAITEDLDTAVGRVLASLDKLGLASNTYVIYTSDNGGSAGGGGGGAGGGGAGGGGAGGGRGVLSGGKGDVFEAGIRVPLIVRGPGVEAGSWRHTPVVGYDWFPTFCAWAGVPVSKLPPGLEGGSLVELLTDGKRPVRRPREELVFHFPHYQGDTPHSAIRLGDLKLIQFYEDDRAVLFNLASDLAERRDLAAQQPHDVQRLRERLASYLRDVNAQLPTTNPSYDPAQPAPPRKQGGKNGPPKPGKTGKAPP